MTMSDTSAGSTAVLVLVGAESVEGVAVRAVDRRSGQAEQEGVGQCAAHLASKVDFLAAVGLVGQHDDVVAVIQNPLRLAEPEDRGDDDLAGILGQQPLQFVARARLLQVRRTGRVESAGDLRIEVDPVDHDDYRRVPERRMQSQLARREQHQQRLAGALEVPDQALLRMAGDHPLDDAVRRLDLLVARDHLRAPLALAGGVRSEAVEQVQHHVRAEHRRDVSFDSLQRRRPAAALLPPRPPEIDRQADRPVAQVLAFGGDRAHVRHEQFRHIVLVVVMDLRRPVEPALARPHRRLRLDDDQRQPIHQQHDVRPPLVRARVDGVLGGDDVLVPLHVVDVDEPDGDVLAVRAERHRPIPGQPRRELLVRLHQPVGPHAHQDGSQPVEHVVGPVGLRRDLRVEANQRLADVVLDQNFVRQPRQELRSEVVPAEAGERAVPAGTAGADCCVVGDTAAEDVAEECFDRVRFGEGHEHCDSLRTVASRMESVQITGWPVSARRGA